MENVTEPESYEWLRGVETPLLWRPANLEAPLAVYDHLLSQEKRLASRHKEFTFTHFVVKLLLGCELFVTENNGTAALLELDRLEHELNRLDIVSHNIFYKEVRRAQWHVTLASRAFLLARLGKLEDSKQIVGDNFDPVSTFTNIEFGGLYGIKSLAFLEYGEPTEALRWAKDAIHVNPREPEWHLLAGRAMESLRKKSTRFSGLPKEEINYFKKAVDLSDRTNYALYLARIYEQAIRATVQHYAHDTTFKSSPLYQEIGNLTRTTVELYRKILESHKNCSETQIRCLNGMLKLPRQYLNEDEMKTIIDKISKEANKSKKFYSAAASFYLKIERSNRKALTFFEKGSDHGDHRCAMNALRLRVKMRQDFDVEGSLLYLVKRAEDDPVYHEDALVHLGSFYLFRQRNLADAMNTFLPVIERNPTSHFMSNHVPMFLRTIQPMNLFSILLNELRVAEVEPGITPLHSLVKLKFMRILKKYHKPLTQKNVDIHLIDKLFRASDSLDPNHRRMLKKRRMRLRNTSFVH
ncbi:hypothetical protein J6590_058064 [Homalodisca vitripennis]|nr:hypothetical protein J6590_058064 [Homalodisca vitripennis]